MLDKFAYFCHLHFNKPFQSNFLRTLPEHRTGCPDQDWTGFLSGLILVQIVLQGLSVDISRHTVKLEKKLFVSKYVIERVQSVAVNNLTRHYKPIYKRMT